MVMLILLIEAGKVQSTNQQLGLAASTQPT